MTNENLPSQLAEHLGGIQIQLDEIRHAIAEVRGLVGPFGVRIDENQLLVQTLYGTKYLIDPHDLIMTPQLIVYRQWEPDLSNFFINRINSDTVFVDIGANFGYFTCLIGSRIGTSGSGRVYAIEPNPALVRLLQANILINWSMCPIDVHPIALGAVERMVQLCVPFDRAANGSLTATPGAGERLVDVEMKRLDDLIPFGVAVNLIKLDVEGHEHGVLSGAKRVIEQSPEIEIVMEWSSKQMIAAGFSIDAMLGLIQSLSLRMMKIPAIGSKENYEEYAIGSLTEKSYDNVLLVKR